MNSHRPVFTRLHCLAFVILAAISLTSATADPLPRERLLMDFGWKFHLGDDWGLGEQLDKAGVSTGPAASDFSDGAWRTVNLPHDWVPELPFDAKADLGHGFKPVGPGFHDNSVGWYRRAFKLPESDQGRRLILEFDGAYRDCRVFFNGYVIGHHESGYSSFRYDITDLANCGGDNTLAVRVDASQFEGWFYEGAGIYRHVWLEKTSPLHIAPDGTFVYSAFPNNVPQDRATVHIQTLLHNAQTNPVNAAVECEILDGQGKNVAHSRQAVSLEPWTVQEVSQRATVASPALWSPETPRLYKLVTTVRSGGELVDRTETEFGIRTVAFDPDKGFLLNGNPYEIKGTCNHQDHAGVGSALPDALQYFRVSRLKEMGDNAIRTSHNAPTPELLEACDRLGMLVMDENRLMGSDARNLGFLEDQVRRDRNHPSVFIWSLFNEEDRQTTPAAARIADTMQHLAHRLDPTRLCTAAGNVGNVFQGANSVLDVRGWNYYPTAVDAYHKDHPMQPEIGTEQGSTVSTRGIYANDKDRGYVSAYDDNAPPWANTAEFWWKIYAARPWLSGGFVWTGFDYRGEPTPYGWPCINSHFGVLDTCGFPKDNFYYYQSWWSDRTVLHVLPHWNWPGKEGQDIDVRCLSNCEEVELFLNGESLGRKKMPLNSELRWTVKYTPGTLLAKGYKADQVIAQDNVETTGVPARIKLLPDRASINADGQDISIITVAVTDAEGRIVPTAENLIDFDLGGPGKIIGVGNGDPSCHEPDVYVPAQPSHSVALKDWRTKLADGTRQQPETAETFDDSQWDKADVSSDAGPLTPGQSAIYRADFEAGADMLASPSTAVNFGTIDDDGWVYLNGHLVGESHDWTSHPSFELRKFLHEGKNTIAVAVHNGEGSGGVNKGVSLEIADQPIHPQWKRSVFNGLAQVIVQAGKEPGTLALTARADGLGETPLNISAGAAVPRPAVP
ncbi:MAG TPA: beta-galactosidase GalA [Candidatus Saccharimonadales bacterium]|nr:beta-galactosidase GalA [Candidatus Saccharimonadales bacterium]